MNPTPAHIQTATLHEVRMKENKQRKESIVFYEEHPADFMWSILPILDFMSILQAVDFMSAWMQQEHSRLCADFFVITHMKFENDY